MFCPTFPSSLRGREALEVEEARKSCTPTQPALPPVAPSFSSMKAGHSHHESRSARMHGGKAVLTMGMSEKIPGAASGKTEIPGVLFCSQYCFLSTSLLGFSPIFGPDPETWTPHFLTTHHTTNSRDPSPGPTCPHQIFTRPLHL